MGMVWRLSALRTLTALHLYGCRMVTDDGVCAMAQSLTRLLTLNMGDGPTVTDVAVAAVARLPRLAQLNLRAATEMTDVGARALAAASTLTCLDLSRVRCCMRSPGCGCGCCGVAAGWFACCVRLATVAPDSWAAAQHSPLEPCFLSAHEAGSGLTTGVGSAVRHHG
jgi:hypothetical protein